MSVARGFGLNGKSTYQNIAKPMVVWANFIVDSTNANGFGCRSVKSNGYVESVFMHTTQTPGVINLVTNPNPVAGYALIRFKNNFNYYLGGFQGQIVPLTSTNTTALTAGHIYVITLVGTTTLANWQAVGLMPGLTPAIGQAFVATATVSITGTGTVGLPGNAVANAITVVGDPNTSIGNTNIAQNAGAQVLVQFAGATFTSGAYTPAGTVSAPLLTMASYTPAGIITNGAPDTFAGTPAVLTGTNSVPIFTGTPGALTGTIAFAPAAPADGTVVAMSFNFDGSSVTIDGL